MFSSPYLPSLRKIIKFYVRASKCTYHSRFHLGNPCFLHLKIPERKGFVELFWVKPPLISRGGANNRGTLFPGRGKTLKESDFPPFFPPTTQIKLLSLFYPNNAKQNFPFLSVGVSAWQVILWRVRYLTYFLESNHISHELSRIKTKVIGSHNLGEIPLVSVRTKATVMGKT